MTTTISYLVVGVLLVASIIGDRRGKTRKTAMALRKGLKAFENILPQFLAITVITGIMLTILDTATITRVIGSESGIRGVVSAVAVGSITLIPGVIAFPMAAMLLANGAGFVQLGAFIASLTMVGVVTFPVERAYFGTKAALLRNGLALLFAFVVAGAMAWVFSWA